MSQLFPLKESNPHTEENTVVMFFPSFLTNILSFIEELAVELRTKGLYANVINEKFERVNCHL